MMKVWKKILAVCCMAAVLAAMPGMQALANDVQTESDSIASTEEVAPVDEELVGNVDRYVGGNLKASYDSVTGEVVFYATHPEGGTLDIQWPEDLLVKREDIKSIRVSKGPVYLPAESGYEYHNGYCQAFAGLTNLTSLDLSEFDFSKVTNMYNMFAYCASLTSLDLSSLDTTKVTNMESMFDACTSLTDLNLSVLNTSNVTNMDTMFARCRSLTSIDLSSFDTLNVEDMSGMFSQCKGLTSLDFRNYRNFKTSNVKDMSSMFSLCTNLTSLDVSSFDTSKVESMSYMFRECSNLKSLDLSSFNTSNVTRMFRMFQDCSSLTELDVNDFNTSNVINMDSVFYGCSSLTQLDVSSFDTSNVTTMSAMFNDCSSLTSLDLSTFDTSKLYTTSMMFSGCSSLTSLNLTGFDMSCVRELSYMFNDCSNLEDLNLGDFGITTVYYMDYMFNGCSKLKSLDLKGVTNDYNLVRIEGMFKDCSSLEYLDISGLDTTRNYLKYFSDVFTGCTSLKTLETPYHNNRQIDLPVAMYDASGNAYTELPVRYESITLTIYDPTLITPTPTVTPTPEPTGVPKPTGKLEPTGIPKPTEKPDPKPIKFSFSDVQNPNHAYYNAIYWAADAGITKGYPDGTFGIDKDCTRGEMMMFLWRYAGKKEPKAVSKSPFKDVPKTHTFYKAILWGSQKGITKGYSDGTFGIDRNVTRGECMMFLWRLKGKPAPKAVAKAPFPDVPKNHVFYNAVLWGYQKKITTGFTSGKLKGKFGVNENCSRGQIVTFLYRAR